MCFAENTCVFVSEMQRDMALEGGETAFFGENPRINGCIKNKTSVENDTIGWENEKNGEESLPDWNLLFVFWRYRCYTLGEHETGKADGETLRP